MKKQLLGLVLASSLLAGCGDSTESALPQSPATARVSSATFLAGDTIPLPDSAEWVEVGDFNGDLRRDLVVGLDDRVVLLLGNGDGTFDDPQEIDSVNGDVLNVADLNGDGFLDVASSDLDGPQIRLLPGNGDGTFDPALIFSADANVNEVHSADFDLDGDLDLGISLPTLDRVQILTNNGAFNFSAGQQATVPGPSGLAVADYNGDGRGDLGAALDDPAGVRIVLNLANGLQLAGSQATGTRSFSAAAGDFNADGRADLAGIELDDTLSVYFGDGLGGLASALELATSPKSFQIVAANLNGDNHTDLVVGCRDSGELNLYVANSEGGFDTRPDLGSPRTTSVTTGDVNGDGLADIISVSDDSLVHIFLGQP